MEIYIIEQLIGKTLTKIEEGEYKDELIFYCDNGEIYKMHHEQDCCEGVWIDSISGDLEDLIGNPLLVAEEVYDADPIDEEGIAKTKHANERGTCTWTFYKFATIKGYVDIRWFGNSNGYYSESVKIDKIA